MINSSQLKWFSAVLYSNGCQKQQSQVNMVDESVFFNRILQLLNNFYIYSTKNSTRSSSNEVLIPVVKLVVLLDLCNNDGAEHFGTEISFHQEQKTAYVEKNFVSSRQLISSHILDHEHMALVIKCNKEPTSLNRASLSLFLFSNNIIIKLKTMWFKIRDDTIQVKELNIFNSSKW